MKCQSALILTAVILLLSTPFLIADEEKNPIQEKVLLVSLSPGELSYDPLLSYSATEAQVYSALYEGLVTYHPLTLEPLPGAARSWEVSPDNRTYRFTLREDALYWNGDPVTAEDFRETWLMLLEPERRAPYSFLLDGIKGARDYRTGKSKNRNSIGIRVEGKYTLAVELADPFDPFLKILCHHSFVPLHPQVREIIDNGAKAPGLGNGPYFLYDSRPDEVNLIKNELYWDAPNVEIQKIRFLFHTDPDEAARLFNEGKIHWSLGNITVDQIKDLQSVTLNPLFATTYYYFSIRQAPFNDSRVRRALALLLPWKDIRSEEFYYTPASTLIPPVPGYPEVKALNTTDKKEALELLAQAGYPKGTGLPPIVLMIPQSREGSRVITAMKENWERALNTKVEVKPLPSEVYYDALEEGDYTLGTHTWIGDFADPLTFLQMWASDSNLNSGGFRNEDYDLLLVEANRQTGSNRMKTLAKAEELLLQQGEVLPISHQPALNVVDLTLLEGWYPNPLDIHPFKYLSFLLPELPPNVAQAEDGRFDANAIFWYN